MLQAHRKRKRLPDHLAAVGGKWGATVGQELGLRRCCDVSAISVAATAALKTVYTLWKKFTSVFGWRRASVARLRKASVLRPILLRACGMGII